MRKKIIFLLFSSFLLSCSDSKNETQETENSDIKTAEKINKKPSDLQNNNQPENAFKANRDRNDPIRFYFTPSVNEKLVREKGMVLLSFLEKETNQKYELHIPKNYNEMIHDFGSKKADVAIMNSLSYVKARESYGVTAKLRGVRYGKSIYFGQIIGNADKGINDLKDLQGKIMAYTDSSSTSGYLFPQKVLREHGIKPSKTIFVGQHDEVVKMVYQGKADAGATFYSEPSNDGSIRDARSRVLDQYPDVAEKVKVLEITEPIPNDPVVFAKNLPDELSYKISLGLIKFMSTEIGKKTMKDLYSLEGFVRCSDADYNSLRSALTD